MKKILSSLLLAGLVMFTATGCSKQTCEQGTKCKVLSATGFEPEIYPPSRVTVGYSQYNKLIAVDTTTHTVNETITVRMADKLNLVVQIRFQLRMGEKTESLDAVFNDIIPKNGNTITLQEVYHIYGALVANRAAREVLSKYKNDQVSPNFARISKEIRAAVKQGFKPTPLIVSDVALGKLVFPKVIDDAIQAEATRTLAIKTTQAEVQRQLAAAKGQELLADSAYRIKMKEAQRIHDFNVKVGRGITPALLKMRALEVQEKMAENKNAVFAPYEAFGTPGMSNRVYRK